ncbi:MAG: DNA polymerase IV [Candidatus Omnitrophica bacterium]|nr:DNA polymerase IV [Candidatus Omnitrophota bacterium]
MILHIDMDAFFASIEQAINPHLLGKPLIVGSRANKMRTVVCAASYEAKTLGIHSGMPSKDAFNLCPNLEFVAADQAKYIWTSEQIFELLKGYGFILNYASVDEFQMDILEHPEPLKLAERIREQIYANFNITASIGLAKNWLLAKLASKINKPNGLTLINESNFKEVLARTAIGKLCGMAGKTGQAFIAQGLKTCWDLYLKLPEFFDENPGKFEEADESKEQPKSISHSYTLPSASGNPQFILAWIRLLSEMVGQRLRQQNLIARTVHLWLNNPQAGDFLAQKTFSSATNDSYEIYLRSLRVMARMPKKGYKIRALGVTASGLSRQSYLPLLTEEKRREALIKATDRINSRFGESSIFPAQVILTRK